jgi:hypothetical protein
MGITIRQPAKSSVFWEPFRYQAFDKYLYVVMVMIMLVRGGGCFWMKCEWWVQTSLMYYHVKGREDATENLWVKTGRSYGRWSTVPPCNGAISLLLGFPGWSLATHATVSPSPQGLPAQDVRDVPFFLDIAPDSSMLMGVPTGSGSLEMVRRSPRVLRNS